MSWKLWGFVERFRENTIWYHNRKKVVWHKFCRTRASPCYSLSSLPRPTHPPTILKSIFTFPWFVTVHLFSKFISFFPVLKISFCINRKQFLDPGESVLMISMVKKLQKLTNKKVQLILTNKPKIIYVDPAKLVVKGSIIWSDIPNDLSVQVTSPSNFKICTVSFAYFLIWMFSLLHSVEPILKVLQCYFW